MKRGREVVALMVVAASQRSALTSVPPQINAIRSDLHLSLSQFAALTSIPLICFGVAAPIGISKFARRKPTESAILFFIGTLVVALSLRAIFDSTALFVGTVLASLAIAALNVLVPVVIKRDFGSNLTKIMPVYTVVLATFATMGAALSVPISKATTHNWRGGIAIWVIIPIIALILWIPVARHHSDAHVATTIQKAPWRTIFRDPMSWYVTLYMGIQSTTFYTTVAWLPKTLIDWGHSPASAGSLLAMTTGISIPCSLLIPLLLGRGLDQRKPMVLVSCASLIGFVGMAAAHNTAPLLWIVLLGIGQSSFPTALVMIALRARSVSEAGPLSAMAQGVGYIVAAMGPIIVGQIHQATDSWKAPYFFLASLCVLQFFIGWRAAQPRPEELAAVKDSQ